MTAIQTFLAVLAYALVGFLSLFVTENMGDAEYNKPPLTDVIHDRIAPWPENKNVPNYLVVAAVAWTILRLMYVDPARVGLYVSLLVGLLVLRLPAFVLTLTPPPGKGAHCRYRAVHRMFTFSLGDYGNCVDNMFSGHAAHIVLSLCFILAISGSALEKVVFSAASAFSMFVLSSSRFHYTSDVYIGCVISALLFLAAGPKP